MVEAFLEENWYIDSDLPIPLNLDTLLNVFLERRCLKFMSVAIGIVEEEALT